MYSRSARAFLVLLIALTLGLGTGVRAQEQEAADDVIAEAIAGLKLRGIGPALMGGRIAHIEVSSRDGSTWFVAVGSGGLWKTTNAGITWAPVFDEQASYSIGTVALDPNNPDVVFVGTGENVSGRHVGWGDGVYRSRDAGRTWERVGLEASEHIGKIIVHPHDSNIVFVAAEGPLWAPGGDRGLYRSTDGGNTWEAVLQIDENTGVTDLELDPSNPDVMYAAAYQRRRHVWSLLAGGPESGIYKSTDGSDTWRRIRTGLPSGDVGKIGLAVTLADPEIVYATIEADEDERGFYRSLDKGESWEQRDSYVSGGTGPHYYQEIEASAQDPDLVYQMDVFLRVTRDGGATFNVLGTGREKHSDNHALWIDPDDGDHLLAGTDAGLYESFDEGTNWRHFPNLPVSQFYKLALDNAVPFYNILGGAQDLGTLHGPSRTLNIEGVRNRDWYVPMGADGYGVAIDPGDPNILYLETQVGNLQRVDRRSAEAVDIKPLPAPGDAPERWNWDSPILVSPHDPSRLYFGSQRVWRSENRGDSWTAISDNLTRNTNRYELEMMGRVWSVDSLYDTGAMSMYSTLTAISESPVAEGVLATGSDDGLIHVSDDGGATWRQAESLPGVPERSFINDVEFSQHDDATLFALADAHKLGDNTPYVFVSTDRGANWRSIAGDLPEGTIVWALQQDHDNPDLLFLGAEFGLYVSTNGGTNWFRLPGAPTIPFRDIKLQRRDNDLVGATFGRGFYVLDDYTPLREIASGALDAGSTLFPVRDAWWYVPSVPMQAPGKPTLGSDDFTADNPPFGAIFTYYLSEVPSTMAQERAESEQQLREAGENVPFPGWERLQQESVQGEPRVLLVVRDGAGEPVRFVQGPAEEGLHRVSWDLRRPPPDPVDLSTPGFVPPWAGEPRGALVAPGQYRVELVLVTSAGVETLGEPREFTVKPVPTAPDGTDFTAATRFQSQAAEMRRRVASAEAEIREAREQLRFMRAALLETPRADPSLFTRMDELGASLRALQTRLSGDPIRGRLNEPSVPSINARAGRVFGRVTSTRMPPTATQRTSLEIAQRDFGQLRPELTSLLEGDLAQLEADLEAAGAPWTPGRRSSGS